MTNMQSRINNILNNIDIIATKASIAQLSIRDCSEMLQPYLLEAYKLGREAQLEATRAMSEGFGTHIKLLAGWIDPNMCTFDYTSSLIKSNENILDKPIEPEGDPIILICEVSDIKEFIHHTSSPDVVFNRIEEFESDERNLTDFGSWLTTKTFIASKSLKYVGTANLQYPDLGYMYLPGIRVVTQIPFNESSGMSWAIEKNYGITVLKFGKELHKITDGAGLSFLQNLVKVDMSECVNLKHLPKGLFSKCRNLKTVELPPNLESMPENLFKMSTIEELIIPDNVENLNRNALLGATHLKYLKLPKGMKGISTEFMGSYKDMQQFGARSNLVIDCTNLNNNAYTILEYLLESNPKILLKR